MERASFLAYGMENERFISWGYEDDERLLRAHKLGLKVSREPGVIYHVRHRRGPDSRPDNPYTLQNATELKRIKDLSDARLRAEVNGWPWKTTRRDVKVLFWNALWHEDRQVVDPRDRGVEIVRDRSRLDECDVVVVGLPMLTMEDIPPPSGATSVMLSREAGAHVPGIDDETVTGRFDVVASHRRGSGLWCPYVPVSLLGDLPEIVPVDERVEATASAWISSDWDASGRVELLNELMLHMQVDSYGRVAKNTGDQLIRSHLDRWRIASRYRFVLAFENAREPDYVTEKFFEPLMFGAVPVYLGAPNVADFAPGEHCYINASDFSSARELAEFLTSMSDEEYLRYHAWRSQPRRPEFVSLCEGIPTAVLSPLVASIRERRSPTPTR
jgi:hypothetical protein